LDLRGFGAQPCVSMTGWQQKASDETRKVIIVTQPIVEIPPESVTVLIIDDEVAHAEAMRETLARVGYNCIVATSGAEGAEKLEANDVDVVVSDLVMPDLDGMEILRLAKKKSSDVEVILVTGKGTIETAVKAIQDGAHTYLTKPINLRELRTWVAKAVEKQRLTRKNVELQRQLDKSFGFAGIIGHSPQMMRVFDVLQQVSPMNVSVLIYGETGTGKELVARAIHVNSRRKNYAFVPVHCAALSEGILESELFGHEKGAFTGAVAARQGRFEYANKGTIFFDEVADMPESTQVKLLRVLEDGTIMRVGSNQPVSLDVRVIAATNRNLEQDVAEGRFREDLYFRLKVITIELPTLAQRAEDIPLLIDYFIKQFNVKHDKRTTSISPEAHRILLNYSWPGNIRELRNTIENMMVMSKDETVLGAQLIPDTIVERSTDEPAAAMNLPTGTSIQAAEAQLIRNALRETSGNREAAAKLLNIGERTLYRKLKKYNIT